MGFIRTLRIERMPSKFKVGDRVRLTGHEAKIITGKTKKPVHKHLKSGVLYSPKSEDLKLIDRNRPRTITRIKYDPKRKRNLYYLGLNRRGKSDRISAVPFDSTQLTYITHQRGRPRQKRKYRHIKHRKSATK